jgi:hypothetical protein
MFDVTIGRAACEACSATWNLGTNSVFALGPKKTMENLDRVDRSQDLPDGNWLLASSPALNTRALTLVHIWAVFSFFLFSLIFFFSHKWFFTIVLLELYDWPSTRGRRCSCKAQCWCLSLSLNLQLSDSCTWQGSCFRMMMVWRCAEVDMALAQCPCTRFDSRPKNWSSWIEVFCTFS